MCSVEWCQAHEVDQCVHGARHEAVIGEITRRDRSMIAVRPDRADFWQYEALVVTRRAGRRSRSSGSSTSRRASTLTIRRR
jgi:hypothetical protein